MGKNEKKSIKILSVIRNIIIAILSIILVVNLFIIFKSLIEPKKVPGLFGYKPFIVLSNSMETKITAGDLVIVKETDAKSLKVDDIIAFRDSDDYVVTHRIIKIYDLDTDICFDTKGDNNNTQDAGPVCSNKIEGKFVNKIPLLGHVILFIQQPYGIAIMILALVIISILIMNSNGEKISKEELKEFEEFKKKKKQESKNKSE